jgi:GntR family transcriptional regulator, transcriptional repressor for pyruvate dehydrogenase complex
MPYAEHMATETPAPTGHGQFFRPIVGARAFAEVVDQLTFAIRSGYFSVGDRLPTMDELAREMGVSKPTVGEAIKVLADAKVLRVRRGATGGVDVISQIVPAKALRLSSQRRARRYTELVEARHAIELELAILACKRATEEDLAELESHVRVLKKAKGGSREWMRGHLLFHYALARAAHSDLLAYYHHQVLEEMTVFFGSFPPRYADREAGIRMHTETFQALQTRDAEQVTKAVINHLRDLEEVAESLENGPSRAGRGHIMDDSSPDQTGTSSGRRRPGHGAASSNE